MWMAKGGRCQSPPFGAPILGKKGTISVAVISTAGRNFHLVCFLVFCWGSAAFFFLCEHPTHITLLLPLSWKKIFALCWHWAFFFAVSISISRRFWFCFSFHLFPTEILPKASGWPGGGGSYGRARWKVFLWWKLGSIPSFPKEEKHTWGIWKIPQICKQIVNVSKLRRTKQRLKLVFSESWNNFSSRVQIAFIYGKWEPDSLYIGKNQPTNQK